MSVIRWKKGLATGAVLLALAVPALADDDDGSRWPRWGMGQMMMGGHWGSGGPMMGRWGMGSMGGPMMGYGAEAMLDRIDGRLAFLKAELKVTDEQEQAWDDLAQAIRATAETRNDMMRSMMEDLESGDFDKMSLPDRLTLRETHLEARLEETRSVKAAVDALYVLLSDEQKEVADEIVLPTMGMGMGKMRGFGPGRMMRQ